MGGRIDGPLIDRDDNFGDSETTQAQVIDNARAPPRNLENTGYPNASSFMSYFKKES